MVTYRYSASAVGQAATLNAANGSGQPNPSDDLTPDYMVISRKKRRFFFFDILISRIFYFPEYFGHDF